MIILITIGTLLHIFIINSFLLNTSIIIFGTLNMYVLDNKNGHNIIP